MIKLLAALSLLISAPVQAPARTEPSIPATVDLSAVRYLLCKQGDNYYTGSGFLIGSHILATARHVAIGNVCIDAQTQTRLIPYHLDDKHDFALMYAPGIPDNIPYVKYRCDGIIADRAYLSFGVTDYGTKVPILRMNTVVATNVVTQDDNAVNDFPHSAGMIAFLDPIAPGMSGGPVVDLSGYAIAVNNAGDGHNAILFDLKDTILCK